MAAGDAGDGAKELLLGRGVCACGGGGHKDLAEDWRGECIASHWRDCCLGHCQCRCLEAGHLKQSLGGGEEVGPSVPLGFCSIPLLSEKGRLLFHAVFAFSRRMRP